MNVKKSLIAAGALVAIGAGLVVANPVHADSTSTSLVDKLVAKFNLNKADVQAVFDEQRSEHQAEMKTKVEERLQSAVDAGKLTADQKTAILAKLDELQANKPDLSGKTKDEIKALMDQKKVELDQWAKDNNIPLQYLRFMGPHGHGGHGMRLELND